MNPIHFVLALAVLSLAMVAAMVRFSRAVLLRSDSALQWGLFYAAMWVAILGLIAEFLGDTLEANRNIFILVPGAFIILHALLLRLGMALRDTPRPAPPPPAFPEYVEEEEDEEVPEPPPPPPTLLDRLKHALRWVGMLALTFAIIIAGQSMRALHELDASLAPHRDAAAWLLGIVAVIAFAAFMIGVFHNSKTAIAGAVTVILAGCALAIVFGPPGIKLLVIVAISYAAVRTMIGMHLRKSSPPQ